MLGWLIAILDVIGREAVVPEPPRRVGRPREDRRALARPLVAKAAFGIPTAGALIERLSANKSLRRVGGWE
ncbi:MAG: transposase [Pseudomonadota bacterium]|nr:transposase [Pseudomonadota bacterium]